MKLIKEPVIDVVAETKINPQGLEKWITSSDLDSVCDMQGTPLSNLWKDVGNAGDGERLIEFAGRHCYRAWEKGRPRSEYIRNLIDMEHTSVLEHANITFAFSGISRSLTLELIRHRVGIAISQESQRYVDAKDIEFIVPPLTLWLHDRQPEDLWLSGFEADCEQVLASYMCKQYMSGTALDLLLDTGATERKAATRFKKRINEDARAHLSNAAETRMVWTANYRLLRHFLFLRGGMGADLEIRRLAVALLAHCQKVAPTVFNDLEVYTPQDEECFGVPIIRKKRF